MGDDQQLGLYSDIPFGLSLLNLLDRALSWLYRHITLIGWSIILLISFSITSELRALTDSWIVGLIMFGLAVAGYVLLGLLATHVTMPRFAQLAFGKPVFGRLGGAPSKIFFATQQASHAVKMIFDDEDQATMKAFNELDRQITEAIMKDRFRATFEDEVPADFEDKWSQVWNEQILKLHTGGLTLKDSLDDEAHPFRIIPGRLAITATLLSTLVDIFQALALFAIVLYLNHVIELVNAVQIGSLLIFVLSLLVFLHHSFQLNEYALQPAPGLPQSIQDQFKEQFKLFEARRVIAKQVTVDRTYLSAVRRYFMRFLIMTFYNSLNTLILVGVMVLIGLIGFPAQHDPLLAWYGALAIGVVILPFAVLIGFYLTFLLLQSFGKIMAPVVAALLGALLPFGVEFIVTGQVDWSKAQNALAAAVSGATALIITAITSQVRGKLEASG